MTILLVLVPISGVLLGLAIAAFVWAVRSGQFENLDSAALEVLVEDGTLSPTRTAARRRENVVHGIPEATATDSAGDTAAHGDGDLAAAIPTSTSHSTASIGRTMRVVSTGTRAAAVHRRSGGRDAD